jgi:hypothetical protein
MSTGDQSEYLRKKMAERRSNYEQGGQFMKSGYSLWAENERPARQGGAAKEASEKVSTKAGKDILDRVKSMGEDMFSQYYKGSARHIAGHDEDSDSDTGGGYSGNGMEGGEKPRYYMVPTPAEVAARKAKADAKAHTGKGKLEEHGADLIKMSKGVSHKMPDGSMMAGLTHPKKGKGKMECVHHEDGHGTHVRRVGGAASMAVEEVGGRRRQTRKGKGFKEGVDASVKTADHIGDVAKHGYDAYEKGMAGDLFGAIDETKDVLSAGLLAKRSAQKAADEFAQMGGAGKRNARAAIVKKIMKEKGLSLPAASKYVKEHGLYKA